MNYWGPEEAELLTATTAEDALESLIDDLSEDAFENDMLVTVHEFTPVKMNETESSLSEAIENFLSEHLDEDYGNPEEAPDIPDTINNAIKELAKAVLKDWPIWRLERTGKTESVHARTWWNQNMEQK
jgi:hypothetical protein